MPAGPRGPSTVNAAGRPAAMSRRGCTSARTPPCGGARPPSLGRGWIRGAPPARPPPRAPSHALILGSFAALRRHPVDDLIRVHDVARLTVHAVRGVDVQLLAARAIVHHLVHV